MVALMNVTMSRDGSIFSKYYENMYKSLDVPVKIDILKGVRSGIMTSVTYGFIFKHVTIYMFSRVLQMASCRFLQLAFSWMVLQLAFSWMVLQLAFSWRVLQVASSCMLLFTSWRMIKFTCFLLCYNWHIVDCYNWYFLERCCNWHLVEECCKLYDNSH